MPSLSKEGCNKLLDDIKKKHFVVKDGVQMIKNPITNRMIKMVPPSSTFVKLASNCNEITKGNTTKKVKVVKEKLVSGKEPSKNTDPVIVIEYLKKLFDTKFRTNPIITILYEYVDKIEEDYKQKAEKKINQKDYIKYVKPSIKYGIGADVLEFALRVPAIKNKFKKMSPTQIKKALFNLHTLGVDYNIKYDWLRHNGITNGVYDNQDFKVDLEYFGKRREIMLYASAGMEEIFMKHSILPSTLDILPYTFDDNPKLKTKK